MHCGCLHMHSPRAPQTQGLLISTYIHDKKAYQELYQQTFLFTSDQEDVERWQQQILLLMRAQPHRPRRLLVIVNPYGGRRRAKSLWQTMVAPMMSKAGRLCVGGRIDVDEDVVAVDDTCVAVKHFALTRLLWTCTYACSSIWVHI